MKIKLIYCVYAIPSGIFTCIWLEVISILVNKATLLFSEGHIGRTYSEKCLDILTGLLGLKQEHITSGKKGHKSLDNSANVSSMCRRVESHLCSTCLFMQFSYCQYCT